MNLYIIVTDMIKLRIKQTRVQLVVPTFLLQSIVQNWNIVEYDISDRGSTTSSDVSIDSIADIPVETDVSIPGPYSRVSQSIQIY